MQLGKILLCMGYITDDQLEEALHTQKHHPGIPLGLLLIQAEAITEKQLVKALEAQERLLKQNPAKVY